MLKFGIRAQGFLLRQQYTCAMCGERGTENWAAVSVDDGGYIQGVVCPQCLRAGAKGTAQRARDYALYMERRAKAILAMVDELENSTDFPTLAQLKEAEDETRRKFYLQICEESGVTAFNGIPVADIPIEELWAHAYALRHPESERRDADEPLM